MQTRAQDLLRQLGLDAAGGLVTDHAVMSESEAEASVADTWGINAKATRLATEKDDTFRLDAAAGDRFVVKFSNPNEIADEVDFEIALMSHVAQSVLDVPVPRYLETRDGRILAHLKDRAGQLRLSRLMTFVEGTPLDSTDSSPTERERVGEVLARLRHATSTFNHPSDRRIYAWDSRNLPGLAPLLERVKNPAQRSMLTAGFDRFMKIAAPRLGTMRAQVLHNDFSKSNIIVDHERPQFVKGIIDFGDAVYTGIAVDVSTALLNQLPRNAAENAVNDLFFEGRDVLRGYLRVADLTADELALLPHLVMGRVIGRALITLYRASLVPGNRAYILRNTEQGWAQLRWFLARTPLQVSETFV